MNRNFNEIYQEIYKNGVTELTKLRKKKDLAVIGFILIFILILIIFCTKTNLVNLVGVLVFLDIIVLFCYIAFRTEYMKGFKELVIKRLVYLYNPDFTFLANSGVSRSEYTESFFDSHFDKFHSEDLIQGKLDDKYAFKMCQVKTEVEEKEIDNDGKARYNYHTIFSGLFGVVYIQDAMIMKMDITSNNFLNKYNKSRIEVDSADFEKNYDMFSTDKVRTMEIFTSEVIEEFNKFEEETGNVIQIKVVPNRLYFRIACGESFEAPAIKDALSYDCMYHNFRMIDFPISIISKIIENALKTRR